MVVGKRKTIRVLCPGRQGKKIIFTTVITPERSSKDKGVPIGFGNINGINYIGSNF